MVHMSVSSRRWQVNLERARLQAEAFLRNAQRIADEHKNAALQAAVAAKAAWKATLLQRYPVEETMLSLLCPKTVPKR